MFADIAFRPTGGLNNTVNRGYIDYGSTSIHGRTNKAFHNVIGERGYFSVSRVLAYSLIVLLMPQGSPFYYYIIYGAIAEIALQILSRTER